MDKMSHKARVASKRLCAIVFVAALLLSMVVPAASASEAGTGMNIMLVIDGSGSLKSTDQNGLRYDALDLFLALLTNDGNNVGAVVFNEGSDSFRLYETLSEIEGKSDKLTLSDAVREAGVGGDTNIGAALLKGVNEAAAMTQSNGQPAVVILFSDGKTDLADQAEYEASLQAKEEAIVQAQKSQIRVYTICLNSNGGADPDEMREISERTSGSAVEVDDAQGLKGAFEAFYPLIFAGTGSKTQENNYPADGKLEFRVSVPVYGAEEVNIILNTTELESKSISSPEGQLTDAQIAEYTMSGGNYDVIKLVDPAAGEWVVTLNGAPGKKVTVNVLYNIDSEVWLKTADGGSDYSMGEQVTLEAVLVQNGNEVLDSAVASDYKATLMLTDLTSGAAPESFEMVPDGNGKFTCTVEGKDYTSYTAYAVLTFNDLALESDVVPLNFGNTAPVASAADPAKDILEVTVTPFTGKKTSLNLSDYFTDAQDKQLSYSVISSQLVQDTVDLDEQTGKLIVNTAASRSGDLVLQAKDSQGATAQKTIRFEVTDLRLVLTGSTLAIIIGVIAFVSVTAWIAAQKPWRGSLTVRNMLNGAVRERGDFRGTVKLKQMRIGNCGLDGKFVSVGHNRMEFVSKKPVYPLRNGVVGSAVKRVTISGGTTTIYANEKQQGGIIVDAAPQANAGFGGGFGGGGMSNKFSKKKSGRQTPSSPASNPFR